MGAVGAVGAVRVRRTASAMSDEVVFKLTR